MLLSLSLVKNMDKKLEQLLKDTAFFVRASQIETHYIERMYDNDVSWIDKEIIHYTIGHYNKKPQMLSFNFITINDKLICFYDSISKIVNWNKIDIFINEYCKMNNDTYLKADASNYHLLYAYIKNN